MKSRRFSQASRRNASKLHKHIKNILFEDPSFKNHKVYQEYPVSRVNPEYYTNRHHYDFVILDLEVVIEVMGQQHYHEVDFGGDSEDNGYQALKDTQKRDKSKRHASEEVNYKYLAIKYDEVYDMTASKLWSLIYNAKVTQREVPNVLNKRPDKKKSFSYPDDYLRRAREYRKEAYQKKKLWLKEKKDNA